MTGFDMRCALLTTTYRKLYLELHPTYKSCTASPLLEYALFKMSRTSPRYSTFELCVVILSLSSFLFLPSSLTFLFSLFSSCLSFSHTHTHTHTHRETDREICICMYYLVSLDQDNTLKCRFTHLSPVPWTHRMRVAFFISWFAFQQITRVHALV